MSSELRVAAIKAQARRMVEDWEGPQRGSKPAMIAVMKDLLAALAEAEAARDQYRQRANRAEARMGNYRADNRRLSEARVLVQQQNARLAALAQAARRWAREHPPGHAGKYGGCVECEALGAAALALDARTAEATDGSARDVD